MYGDIVIVVYGFSPYSQEFCNLIKWILKVDPSERPSVIEIEQRLSTMLSTNDDEIEV